MSHVRSPSSRERSGLGPAEITRLSEHNLSGRRGLALWLPVERVDPN